MWALGPPLRGHGAVGVLTTELSCVLLPTVAWLRWRALPAAAVGLGRAAPLATLGGLVAGVGLCYLLAAAIEPAVARLVPVPPDVRAAMEKLIVPATGARPLVLDLVTFALAPALAEELLFRGVLLGALAPRLGRVGAVAVTALGFALYHASPYTLVPAALAGLALGGVRVASGALGPAIALHLANNATVLLLARAGVAEPPLTPVLVAGALGALAGGALLVRRR